MAWKYPSVCIRASNYGESFSSNDAAIIIYPGYKDLTVWRQAFRDVVQFVQSHPHNTGVGEVIPIGLSFGYVSSVTLILPQGKRWCFALIFLNGSILNIWSLPCSIIHGEVFSSTPLPQILQSCYLGFDRWNYGGKYAVPSSCQAASKLWQRQWLIHLISWKMLASLKV